LDGFPFAGPIVIGTGWYVPERVRFADIDGDGRDEVIMIADDDTLRAYPNVNGLDGFPFAGPIVIGSGWYVPERVRFADVDGDGKDEVVLIADDATLRAYPNVNGLDGFPFAGPIVIGTGWHVPERVFFGQIGR